MARSAASRCGVPGHDVLVRLLLQLPRDADAHGIVESTVARLECERVARDLAAATARFADWQAPPTSGLGAVDEIELATVGDTIARVVLERFHYLGSFRPGSEHHGGVIRDKGADRLVALLTVSELDVATIAARLPCDVEAKHAPVLARVFSFDWAPRNTLSFLMARLARALRCRPDPPRLLLTYLNPNVGFSGASYRAANWVHWAREGGTRYAYLDGRYTTDRELQRRFGSATPETLHAGLGDRVSFSRMPLQPLDLYLYPLDSRLRKALGSAAPVELPRPVA